MFFDNETKYVQTEVELKQDLLNKFTKLLLNNSINNSKFGHGRVIDVERVDDMQTTKIPFDVEVVIKIEFDNNIIKRFALTHDTIKTKLNLTDQDAELELEHALDDAVSQYNKVYTSTAAKYHADYLVAREEELKALRKK